MGNSTWNASAWTTTAANYAAMPAQDMLFAQNRKHEVHANFDPKLIKLRESVDSEANPQSTPIILGLDVTGSMGFIAEYIARTGLGKLIPALYDTKPITDPHIMIMAIGDIDNDQYPLQASQFEADIRIAEQLTQLYLEKGGGGNGWESYDMAWLFAALKTKIDSFDKRGKKGYLFTVGDEPSPPLSHMHTKEKLDCVLGRGIVERGYTTGELLELAKQQWAVFHIVVEEGTWARSRPKQTIGGWVEILGPNVICLNDHTKISEVLTAVLQVAEGADIDDVILQAGSAKAAVQHAFGR
jgi:hypothetical protein